MRKLTVKNFSVIKEAELEFGKITVLIGPQASGKSLLCKLAYFLSKEALDFAVETILGGKSFGEFKALFIGRFLSRFSNAQREEPYVIELTEGDFSVRFSGKYETYDGEIKCNFSERFSTLYSQLVRDYSPVGRVGESSIQNTQVMIWTQLSLLLDDDFALRSTYIPVGRAFFTNVSLGFSALQNPDIDPLTRQFSSEISWTAQWQGFALTHGDSALIDVNNQMREIAGGAVNGASDSPVFISRDGRTLPLTLLSSGTQELLPLLNVLSRLAFIVQTTAYTIPEKHRETPGRAMIRSKNIVYVEEPETSIFPSTQFELVRLFGRLSHEPTLDFRWVITTHSPYILTAFNNLIEAGQAVRNNPSIHDKVAEIIPEQYWIKEGDFKAYAIEDGVLKSIVAKDTGLVSANYLDQVSETIGTEFDELLRLGYVES
ncbi:MAG TPA: AAA family ATPase [Terracidiphilus sp.]|jgi:energy-coupling factor transporter ATP-binding protein EcfA2|nr:AAA family ATPase [Terracidiphilus sp.]